MIAPMPCRAISARALARRCSRSAGRDRRRDRDRRQLGRGLGEDALERQRHRRGKRAGALQETTAVRSCDGSSSPSCCAHCCTARRNRPAGAPPMFDSLSHDGVKRPGTREMTVHARRADGAQRLRHRRDDPGAAGHRPVAARRARKRPAAGRHRLFPRLRLDPAAVGAARRPLRAQADPRRRGRALRRCSPCCARSPGASRC